MAAAIMVLGLSVQAATIFKADNTDDLNLATSWMNGVAPTAADVAQWNATVTGPNSVLLGADVSWKGITVTTPGGPVTIGAGNTLTLGTSGITLSAATQDLTISSGLSLSVGNQIWNVAASRTLTLNTGSFSRATGATLNVQGSGTVTPATLANNSAGIIGAWATTGTGSTTRYATISGGNVIGYTGNSVADATLVTDTTGTKVYSVGGAGALTGNSFYALRYFGSTNATISGNCTNNGFMSAGAGNLTISGGVTIGASQELNLTCVNGTMTLSGIIANNPSGASALVKNGSSQLNIGSGSAAVVNTYTGGTWINDGKLQINDNAGSGALGSGDIFVGSGAQLVIRPSTSLPNNNITIGGPTAISLSSANFTMGGLLTLVGNASTTVGNSSGVNQFTFNGGINLNSYTFTMGAGDASQTHNNSINSAITGTGGLTLSASTLTSGTMNLTLGASNSFSGDTTLSVNASATTGAANLKLNNVNALKNSTLNTGSADTHKQVTFVVAGANTYNLGGLKGADDLAIGLNNINVGGNGQNTVFAGIISSTGGGLIKSGAGMLTLSNLNTYTGATTISNGTLALADGAGIASDSIANYGTFDVSAISGGYHLTTGKTLSGAGNVTGPMIVDSGATLTVGGNSGTAGVGTMAVTGDLTLNGTTVLRLNKGGASDQITASGALNLGGTINLNSVGTALVNGDQFQIFSSGNSGTPTITGNPGSGLEWDSSLLNSSGIIKVVAGSNPPVFAEPLTNQTVECGSDASFYALATGTAPLVYTWKVNGTTVQSGTDLTTFTTNNVHSAGSTYTVSVQVSNLVNSATSACTLTVADTLAPVITLGGFSPMSVVQGQTFIDPGATALDSCADVIIPTVSGTVDTSVLGTYAVTYTAGDGNGNTNSVIRTVNVVEYQSGVWTNRVGGTLKWLEGTNWSDNLFAQGPNALADFSTVNIAANTSVRLEQPLTIGDMIFGDTSGAQTWSLGNGGNVANILTLDSTSGSSTITANTDTSISLQL
ncbi:MAG: beta strand repeat-containing protein, partial [Verrucomicrobiota bacterium]